MFRCPSCAVVWKLPLTKGYSLLSNKNMNKWTIEKEPVSFFSKVQEVHTLEQAAEAFEKLGITFDSKREIDDSPVIECPACKNENTFAVWHKAWEFPIDYFESDALCACGGELWWDKIPGTAQFAHVCEKCGWTKPRAIISGHAD